MTPSTVLKVLFGITALTACAQPFNTNQPSNPVSLNPVSPNPNRPNLEPNTGVIAPVGAGFTIMFDGLGSSDFDAHISSNPTSSNPSSSNLKSQALTDQQTAVTPVRVLSRGSVDVIARGAARSSGFRYVYAVVSVTSTSALKNVSFLGVRSSATLPAATHDTAISQAVRAPNAPAYTSSELDALALSVKPAQASTVDPTTNQITPLPNTEDSVQYLPESDLDFVPTGKIGLLPYGFTVLNNTGGRTLSTTAEANRMVIGMKVPLAANAKDDPYAFGFNAVPVTDSLTRVTQSLEAQTPEGSALVVARAAALGASTSITLLPSAIPAPKSANTLEALCQVRTAGEATAATGFVVNRVPISLEPSVKLITKGQTIPVGAQGTDAIGSFFLPATVSLTDSSLATNTVGAITALKKGVTTVTPSSACGVTGTAGGLRVLGNIVPMAGGGAHSLALKSDGTVIGWGGNGAGQTTTPTGLTNVTAITAGGFNSLALKGDGSIIGWGDNSFGQRTIPTGLTNVTAIAAGGIHSLALKSDGTVIGWGRNNNGQTTIPTGLTNVVAITAGIYHNLALKSDGTVIGWGDNASGQITIPTGLTNVTAITAGGFHSLALKSDGTVIGWGENAKGQATIPTGLTNVVAIAAGNTHSLALKSDGTVIGWGTSSQIKIPTTAINVTAMAAAGDHSLALKSDGTVIGWGDNSSGQTTIPSISPLTFMQP
jgi:Regulator of chromosome condensation (RCC1) repeat